MRLIDADSFIANLKNYKDKPMTTGLCATLIELTPTAYDINKVVEKLEENQTITFHLDGKSPTQTIELETAIEIVKDGINYDNR